MVADEELVDRLEQDLGNFRAALTTLTDIGDWERLLQMSGDIAWFMFYRGRVIEGKRWVESALQLADQGVAPGPRAWALIGSGLMTQITGDAARAEQRFAEAAEVAAEAGEEWYRFVATSLRAGALVSLERFDEAAGLFEANLAQSGFGPHPAWQAHTKLHLGIIAFTRDQLNEAGALFAESIELCDQIESYLDAIDSLQYLALVQIRQRRFAQAGTTIGDLLERLIRRRSDSDLAIGIAIIAIFADRLENPQAAVRLFAAAYELRRRSGLPFPEPASTVFLEERPRIEAQFPPEEIEVLRQAGQAMTAAEAIDAARDIVETGVDGLPGDRDADSGRSQFSLTEREIDVLRLIADGLTNEQIAHALFISSGTVRTHIANIFGKLNARTRTEAARIALRNNLI
jgi:ATP/maltotriose-dependent transcriptional regulator MalT